MVLEEASLPDESASYTETVPTSDLDPYSNSNTDDFENHDSNYIRLDQPGAREPIYINTANLPKPFSVFYQAEHSRNLTQGILTSCQHASKVMQRPLRQEEADAFAWHWAASMRVASYGSPTGVSLAMVWAFRQKDYRFPGWQPFKSGRFSPDRLGPLKGSAARAGWNILRYNAYGFIGMTLGSVFFASYALTLHVANRTLDTRLKDFTEALKQRQQGKLMEGRDVAEARRDGETFEMARQRRALQQQQEQRAEASRERIRAKSRRTMGDDASPTGGAFQEDFIDSGSDGGMMSDGQAKQQEYRTENASSTYDSDDTTPRPQQRSTRAPPREDQGKQAVSSWERLRQNAMSGGSNSASTPRSQPTNPSIRSSSQSSESYSFSQKDSDQQLARAEAQKQFDARVEQEREGHDFNEGGAEANQGRGRW